MNLRKACLPGRNLGSARERRRNSWWSRIWRIPSRMTLTMSKISSGRITTRTGKAKAYHHIGLRKSAKMCRTYQAASITISPHVTSRNESPPTTYMLRSHSQPNREPILPNKSKSSTHRKRILPFSLRLKPPREKLSTCLPSKERNTMTKRLMIPSKLSLPRRKRAI